MGNKRFVKDLENNRICEVGVNGFIITEISTVDEVVDTLNELYDTVMMWTCNSKKITKLFKEAVKPTSSDDVFLDINIETKRCKYENTIICNDCDYYSSYFLDCRLMMGDDQYKKALELGLIKNE